MTVRFQDSIASVFKEQNKRPSRVNKKSEQNTMINKLEFQGIPSAVAYVNFK